MVLFAEAAGLHPLALVVAIFAGIFVYFLPSLVASYRNHKNETAIFLLNLFLGASVVGWVAALVWASLANQEQQFRPRARPRAVPRPVASARPAVPFGCPRCRNVVFVPAELVGQAVECGSCREQFTAVGQ